MRGDSRTVLYTNAGIGFYSNSTQIVVRTIMRKNKGGNLYPLIHFRDNARSLQPRSGPDHPRVCLPGSDGGSVLFRGPAHEVQEQTEAQETAHQTAHIPAAAAAADEWEEPHGLTALLSCGPIAGFTSRTGTLLKGQLVLTEVWNHMES